MESIAHIAPAAESAQVSVESMTSQDLRAYKETLLQQINDGASEEDALWGKIARVNAYIRAAGKP